MSIGRLLVIGLCGMTLQGCASIAGYEKAQYTQLKHDLDYTGLPVMKEKEPILAGALNLLPGFGNVYLKQWGPFVGNLLLWPISSIWAVPQAAIDANTINKKETLYFYKFGPGKERLAAAKASKPQSVTVEAPSNSPQELQAAQ